MAEPSDRKPGRPRDPTIDQRVLDATRELLAENGLDATTVQSIAARSGVHASAIYRRWSNRIDILEEAVFPGPAAFHMEPTGDLDKDLRRFIRAYIGVFTAPAARAAIPGLLANYEHSAGESRGRWLAVSARPQFVDILDHAPAGTVAAGIDPDDVFDILLGAILARSLVPTVVARNRPVERLVELVTRMISG